MAGSLGLAGASGAAAQGLVGITVCCPNEFVQVDPATGAQTILSNVGDATFTFSLSSAVDPPTHSFHVIRRSGSLPHVAAINTQTGTLVESPPLAQDMFLLGFDPFVPTPTPTPTPTQTRPPLAVAVPTLSTRALAALALAIAGVSLFVIRPR